MENKKNLFILSLVLVLLLSGAYMLYGKLSGFVDTERLEVSQTQSSSATGETAAESVSSSVEEPEPQKIKAPDFTVYDADGKEAHLTDFVGKPIVLNFWASWCGPCQMEMPDFDEKYRELGESVSFMMVNMTTGRETKEKAMELIKEKGYTFPVFYDTEADAAMTYSAHSLPTTYFIDAEGNAVARAVGAIDSATLQQGIDMISGKSQN